MLHSQVLRLQNRTLTTYQTASLPTTPTLLILHEPWSTTERQETADRRPAIGDQRPGQQQQTLKTSSTVNIRPSYNYYL